MVSATELQDVFPFKLKVLNANGAAKVTYDVGMNLHKKWRSGGGKCPLVHLQPDHLLCSSSLIQCSTASPSSTVASFWSGEIKRVGSHRSMLTDRQLPDHCLTAVSMVTVLGVRLLHLRLNVLSVIPKQYCLSLIKLLGHFEKTLDLFIYLFIVNKQIINFMSEFQFYLLAWMTLFVSKISLQLWIWLQRFWLFLIRNNKKSM